MSNFTLLFLKEWPTPTLHAAGLSPGDVHMDALAKNSVKGNKHESIENSAWSKFSKVVYNPHSFSQKSLYSDIMICSYRKFYMYHDMVLVTVNKLSDRKFCMYHNMFSVTVNKE